jgi:uncharacterized membrane protein
MFLTPLLLIGLVIFIAYMFLNSNSKFNLKSESPDDIARKRYARGEITREEFDIIKNKIN